MDSACHILPEESFQMWPWDSASIAINCKLCIPNSCWWLRVGNELTGVTMPFSESQKEREITILTMALLWNCRACGQHASQARAGNGSHPLCCQEFEALVIGTYFERRDYGGCHMAPRDACISRSFALCSLEIQTISIAEGWSCITMWTWGWLSSQRWCAVSEEIPFFALSHKRNNLWSSIWLHWVLEKGVFEISSLGNSRHLALWSLRLCREI